MIEEIEVAIVIVTMEVMTETPTEEAAPTVAAMDHHQAAMIPVMDHLHPATGATTHMEDRALMDIHQDMDLHPDMVVGIMDILTAILLLAHMDILQDMDLLLVDHLLIMDLHLAVHLQDMLLHSL